MVGLLAHSEFDRHTGATDMFVAATIGIAAIDHGRDGEVQAVRYADADPGSAAIMSGVDGNGGLACRMALRFRCDRDRGDDAAPGLPAGCR